MHPANLLGPVARAGGAAPAGRVRPQRRGVEEVDRVLRTVVEGSPRLGGNALAAVGALAVGVGEALPLGIGGEDDVAALGQRLGGEPVELLGRLHRPVGDDDARTLLGPGAGHPHVPGDRRAVARGPLHGLDDAVAVLLPVVEADVPGAAVHGVRAQVGVGVALGVAHAKLLGLGLALGAAGGQILLVGRRRVLCLALVDLGVVLLLPGGMERERGRSEREQRKQGEATDRATHADDATGRKPQPRWVLGPFHASDFAAACGRGRRPSRVNHAPRGRHGHPVPERLPGGTTCGTRG